MWPFKKKPAPVIDCRVWNEDWRVGDTAEVVPGPWHDDVKPWNRLADGARYTVTGFEESVGSGGMLSYFLHLQGLDRAYNTLCFRKVRTVKADESEVVQRILKAKPGKDQVREDAK